MSTHDSYITADELRSAVGVRTGSDEQVNLACIEGTLWVIWEVGETPTMVPVETPTTLRLVPTTGGRKAAALAAAVRFYNSPQAPFGVLGSGDSLAYVNGRNIPEAALALLGERKGFGIA